MSRMNFLYIGSDQHRYDCIGVHGHPVLKTPNLDALAAGGTEFRHAYSPCPICSPSRASLLTGQWSFRHACLTIPQWTEAHRAYRRDLITFPQLLHEAGYFQAYVGKWHVEDLSGRPQPEDLGIDRYVPDGRYYAWRKEQGIPASSLHRHWTHFDDAEDFDRCIRGGTDEFITPEQSRLAWGSDHVIALLKEAAGKDSPFFIRWDPSEPHLTNVVPEPYASLYDPKNIDPWGSFEEEFGAKPYIQRQQLESWGISGWTWEDWAPVVARYLGEITLLDHQIGRLLTVLEQLELEGETMVIYSTDHGDMCGSHRMMDKHYIMYDDVVRVPLIIRMPGVTRPGRICDSFVSHALDLASTICEAAQVGVPDTFQGSSLMPLLQGDESGGRDDIISAYHGAQLGLFSQRMLRNRSWKYVWNPTVEDELYHLDDDPWELRNLAGDASCVTQLSRMRRRLVAWMEETGDPLLNTWTRFQLQDGRKL